MRIAAFGRTRLLYDTLRALSDRGHDIVLIGTCPAAPEYTVTERDFEEVAARLGCPFFCDVAINKPEYVDLAKASGAQVAVSVNWTSLIGPEMLGAFPHGIVNAHGGDLPRYRGNACQSWAILAGEPSVVLTLHQMAPDLDSGPVLLKHTIPLGSASYIGDVYAELEAIAPQLFVQAVEGLESGKLIPAPQPEDPARSLRCFPRVPNDGLLDWQQPAEGLARLVRASAEPFAGAFTYWHRERLVLWRAHAETLPYPYLGVPGQVAEIRRDRGEVVVLTGDGVLVLQEVQRAGLPRARASDVLKSARIRLGLDPVLAVEALQDRVNRLEALLAECLSQADRPMPEQTP